MCEFYSWDQVSVCLKCCKSSEHCFSICLKCACFFLFLCIDILLNQWLWYLFKRLNDSTSSLLINVAHFLLAGLCSHESSFMTDLEINQRRIWDWHLHFSLKNWLGLQTRVNNTVSRSTSKEKFEKKTLIAYLFLDDVISMPIYCIIN